MVNINKTEISSDVMKLIAEIIHQNGLILSLLCNSPMILEPPEASDFPSGVPERPKV